jgi:hypothetical protein
MYYLVYCLCVNLDSFLKFLKQFLRTKKKKEMAEKLTIENMKNDTDF